MTRENARLLVEVTAGLIPQRPDPEYTRLFALTEWEWAAARAAEVTGKEMEAIASVNGRAQGYAAMLMLQPDRVNWVRTDWIWL
jgi:hypothetical protein